MDELHLVRRWHGEGRRVTKELVEEREDAALLVVSLHARVFPTCFLFHSRQRLLVELEQVVDVLGGSEVDGDPLVDTLGNNVQDPASSCCRDSTSLHAWHQRSCIVDEREGDAPAR